MIYTYKRLAMIAKQIPIGPHVADIGADHAQLAIYLAEKEIAPRVVIGELADGPFARSCEAVKNSAVGHRIEVRQGNGLQVLDWGEVGCVVLAGMGAETIVEILAHDWDKAGSFPYYVFQPMSKAEILRQNLASRGWIITNEYLVEERGTIYLVITSHPGDCPYHLSDLEVELGASILQADSAIKREYLERVCQKYRRIYKELRRSSLNRNQVLADEYLDKITILEGIMNASQG